MIETNDSTAVTPAAPSLATARIPGNDAGKVLIRADFDDPLPEFEGPWSNNILNLRNFIDAVRETGDLATVKKPVDPTLEMAPVIAALDGRPVLFEQVAGAVRAGRRQ